MSKRKDGRPASALCHVISDEFHNEAVERLKFTTAEDSVRSLDSYQFEQVDAMKIDVEDHEFHVLNGARQLLERFRPLIYCELWGSPNRNRCISFIESMKYDVQQLAEVDFLFTPRAQDENSLPAPSPTGGNYTPASFA
jgi:hypothetical protein